MKSLLVEIPNWEPAFLPWRMSTDSMWLRADLVDLRQLVELQSHKALQLAKECGVCKTKEPNREPHS